MSYFYEVVKYKVLNMCGFEMAGFKDAVKDAQVEAYEKTLLALKYGDIKRSNNDKFDIHYGKQTITISFGWVPKNSDIRLSFCDENGKPVATKQKTTWNTRIQRIKDAMTPTQTFVRLEIDNAAYEISNRKMRQALEMAFMQRVAVHKQTRCRAGIGA